MVMQPPPTMRVRIRMLLEIKRKRSTKHTYNQVRFPFTVAFPVSSSTVTTLRSLLPWMHAATA
ncbi:hypothetical protein, partial [Pseudomonas sp. EA_65y_Pfl1_P113]|uniref:hypothetical protein n=1 Tax=Pseudomonas sp. EA_65y_Pfl1_P113 TaxID=3088692 RepID=UPI0030D9C6CF